MGSKVKLAALASFILTATLACNAPADSDAPSPERDAPVGTTTEAPTKDERPASSAANEPASGTVPDVVGMNHQVAQDTMQAAGFYNLTEEDATGQDRMLIMDSNWVVVSQSPKGGAKAAEDTTIVLRSKKIGDE